MSAATVEQTIGRYLDSLTARGVLASSVRTTARVLRSFFLSTLGQPLASLYPDQARHLADALDTRNGKHTGRPLARRTRRNYRDQARAFLRWCAALGGIPHNPLETSAADDSAPEQSQPASSADLVTNSAGAPFTPQDQE